jgi:hypothetical protein
MITRLIFVTIPFCGEKNVMEILELIERLKVTLNIRINLDFIKLKIYRSKMPRMFRNNETMTPKIK